MSKFKDLRRSLRSDGEIKIDVTCPNCGRVTSFSFDAANIDRSQYECRSCQQDLSAQFLSELSASQLNNLKELRKFLMLILVLSFLPIAFLLSYIFINIDSNFWVWLLLAVSLVLFIVSLFFLVKVQGQISRLKKIRDEYKL